MVYHLVNNSIKSKVNIVLKNSENANKHKTAQIMGQKMKSNKTDKPYAT